MSAQKEPSIEFRSNSSHHLSSASIQSGLTPGQRRTSSSTRSVTPEAPLTQEEIERKPWKYIGYRGYANFISSENDFYIVRRFGALNVRVVLALQDQVSVLEEQLKDLDQDYSGRSAVDIHNGSFRNDRDQRTQLLGEIAEALMKYSSSSPYQPRLNATNNF